MNDWTSGYVSDIGYTYGYYPELNPQRVKLAFLNAGLVAPEFATACELGFGQGLSVNVHAAASLTRWYGTDFNPSQAAFAQELSEISGGGARLYDEAFADFIRRDDLPDFDYIGLHGIWSWISDDNRKSVVEFVRRKLKVGGVLYVSYNTFPGWAAFAPMRQLLTAHAEALGSEGGGTISRVDGALEFADKLLATHPQYTRSNPQIVDRLRRVKQQNRRYLAHEYFNRDWHPMHFSDMAGWLEPAKLSYACSAHYLDHVDVVNLTPEQSSFLAELPDANFREAVRDFMVNQQFRRDYWVKGPRKLNALEQGEQLRQQKVVLLAHRPDVPLKMNVAQGEVDLSKTVYNPILDFLADHRPRSLAEIEGAVKDGNLSFMQVRQALMVLIGGGYLAIVQAETRADQARPSSDNLNAYLLHHARGSNDINCLASPLIGGGVPVSGIQQLFLLARSVGGKTPADWAAFVWQLQSSQGQRLSREGKALETAEENIAELTRQAEEFLEKRLPVLQVLRVV